MSYAIRSTEGGWWLMDCGGKLLEPVEESEAAKHTQVLGICAEHPSPGGSLVAGEGVAAESAPTGKRLLHRRPGRRAPFTALLLSGAPRLWRFCRHWKRRSIWGDVTTVDVSSLYDIQLWYGQKYQILLGGPTELTYKIRYMTQAVATLADYQSGVLDLSLEQDRKAIFTPVVTCPGCEQLKNLAKNENFY